MVVVVAGFSLKDGIAREEEPHQRQARDDQRHVGPAPFIPT
jgi:hypothetical protein